MLARAKGRLHSLVMVAGKLHRAKSFTKSCMKGTVGIINMKSRTTTNVTLVGADTDKMVTLELLRWSVVEFDCISKSCQVQSNKKPFRGLSSYELGEYAKTKKFQ